MGTTLTGLTPATTYDALIKVGDNGPLSATAKYVGDGLGNDSVVALSTSSVGIGTTSPTQLLHVAGNVRITGALYDGNNAAGTSGQILSSTGTGTDWVSKSDLSLVDGSGTANYVSKWSDTDTLTNSLIYDNGTNVGIGTTSPATILTVAQATPVIRLQASASNAFHGIEFRQGSGTDAEMKQLPQSGEFRISSGRVAGWGGFTTFYTDTIERLRITSTGNVGIGTSTPISKLTLNNGGMGAGASMSSKNLSLNGGFIGGYTQGNIQSAVALYDGTAYGGDIGYFYDGSGYGISFSTNPTISSSAPTERLRITSAGDVSITTGNIALSGAGGIYFDSGASKYLDDYEEGTFTPTVVGVTTAGTTTYTGQNGYYTKIGRQVTVSMFVGYTSLTGTGDMKIGGLPFAIGNLTENYPVGSCIASAVNWTGGTYLQSIGFQNESNLYIAYLTDDAPSNVQQCVNESATFRITMTYFTA